MESYKAKGDKPDISFYSGALNLPKYKKEIEYTTGDIIYLEFHDKSVRRARITYFNENEKTVELRFTTRVKKNGFYVCDDLEGMGTPEKIEGWKVLKNLGKNK